MGPRENISIRLQLISAETNTSIREANAVVRQQHSERYPFHGKLETKGGLVPGTYLVAAKCFVGDELITTGLSAIVVVDTRKPN